MHLKIPLFDVDWTLIEGGNKAHDAAFDHAFRTVYALPDASKQEIQTDGMIDTQILLEVAKLHHVSETQAREKLGAALRAMEQYYDEHHAVGRCIPLKGVEQLLRHLHESGVPLGLLTGNIESIGWHKVARAGLREFFSFGAFGDLAHTRPELIPIARERATHALRRDVPLEDLVIVGDSPLDVACAKAGGIQVIAVASGNFTAQELAAVGADTVLDSLQEEDAFFDFIERPKRYW